MSTTTTTTTTMSEELKVAKSPDTASAYTNAVYVAPGSPFGQLATNAVGRTYVQFTSPKNKIFVYVLEITPETKDRIKDGFIGMSSTQRKCCKVSASDKVMVKTWDVNFSKNIYKMNMVFRPLSNKAVIQGSIGETDLVDHVLNRFSGHVFSDGSMFMTDFQGITLIVTVKACYFLKDRPKDGDLWVLAGFNECGVVTNKTQISIAPTAKFKSSLDFVPKPKHNKLLDPGWKFTDMGIGGLDKEFGSIFRRAFASRLYPPQLIQKLGMKHVKGMLLHGPPGTGKTLIARQIGNMLSTKEPKLVNGPEILNKYVGASEENIRALFADAEAEWREKKDNSDLHIIIFDEIDAICKSRGTSGGGTGVGDSVVCQLLSKLDGKDILNNVLVIGMTNRKDMLDKALLRPGRLEVHVEIGLPDEEGRVQILNIHTAKMKRENVLAHDVDIDEIARRTKNYSGAEIEGLVKNALSYALYGGIDVTKGNLETKMELGDIKVTMDHFIRAMSEVPPAFGVADNDLRKFVQGGLIEWGHEHKSLMKTVRSVCEQTKRSTRTSLQSILLHGRDGAGKSAIACTAALESDYPFVQMITPEKMVGWTERAKCGEIKRVFEDAYKSPLSLIVLDNIERILDFVAIGPRFSNPVLQTLLVLCKKAPPYTGHKLLIVATTSSFRVLEKMHFRNVFEIIKEVKPLTKEAHFNAVFNHMLPDLDATVRGNAVQFCTNEAILKPISIKRLLMVIEMAKDSDNSLTNERFEQCMQDSGLTSQFDDNRD